MNDLFGPIIVSAGIQYDVDYQQQNGVSLSRGWDGADTNRLNEAQWADVSDPQDINLNLLADLKTLQERSSHEAINNGLVEGALETYATDIAGAKGPLLQMTSDNEEFNDFFEQQIWKHFAEDCEARHGLALVDLLHGWAGQLWTHGAFLAQELIGKTPYDYKILDVGDDRLDTNSYGMGDNEPVLGVEVDKIGKPVYYLIEDPNTKGSVSRVPAAFIVHGFRRRFVNQQRGIPILASGLQPTADLRDYDYQVLQASRAAANNAMWMVAKHPEAPFVKKQEGARIEYKNGQVRFAPSGYEPQQLTPKHPTANYKEYRMERQTEIGQPAQMPLLVLRQDASRHNFSSARFDSHRYTRAIERMQAWFGRRAVDRFVLRLIQLHRLYGTFRDEGIAFPKRLWWDYIWPSPPSVDPEREAMAERLEMENGTLAYTDACRRRGRRPEEVIAQRKKGNEILTKAGLPPISGEIAGTFYDPNNDPDQPPPQDQTDANNDQTQV